MNLNVSDLWEKLPVNSSGRCPYDVTGWEHQMEQLYFWFYLLLFIPGLCLNTTALWVLCRHISKKTKAVIFMVNLALADLLHVMSLPLRIHYYRTHTWPFGQTLCLFCFYLKYLNMYASITFLVCISVQRCVFLLQPFYARRWRRRYDLLISATVWLVVGIFCSPFIIMRISNSTVPGQYTPSPSTSLIPSSNPSYYTGSPIPYSTPSTLPYTSPSPRPGDGCFKDLPTRKLPLPLMAAMMVLAELFGFVLPLSAISYCSLRIAHSLRQRQDREHHQNHRCPSTSQAQPSAQTDREHHHNHRCPSTSQAQPSAQMHRQTDKDKRRALRMVMSCSALFLFCFAPYHVNFLLYVMVSQDIVSHCPTMLAVRHFHPISLCVASLSCCLNPLLYYFLTAEFRQHLSQRTSSLSSSIRGRLMSLESTSSFRE
ncbi:putative P2Y purinoceptor 10 isoform X1 [Salmo salar]|uniref:P2Y purinoceptor 10 isoform X1 n=2 Tax=Salmo salar TaxID=8030 RepID=A0ABM3ERS5_SALSA|nr:putative P2Y purinoceptor 10 isoform X1 [Salmo salar]XP_045573744.1 putative P2Y purinoceptor 10 isoform X1 [Salmo salar]